MRNNNHLLNKCVTLKVIGKGKDGDFFGKINETICFIKLKDGQKAKIDDMIDLKVTGCSEKCVFGELIDYDRIENL